MLLQEKKLKERIISPHNTILHALKQMDSTYQKLLLILDREDFVGVVSIGDIQRAILRKISLDTPIVKIIRDNPRIATLETSYEHIKEQMLEFRMELIPVIDTENHLAKVYFWEDVFGGERKSERPELKATVVIMAGGRGMRLNPLTNVIPKPLVPLGEKSIIENIIDNFSNIGASHFVISVNYKANLIRLHLQELNIEPIKLEYIQETDPLGTAGSLKLLEGKIKDTFFVTNCDILIDQDYRDVWDYHKSERNELTLISSLKSNTIPYGSLKFGEGGKLLELIEKPTVSYFINAGMYVVEPHLLKEIPENKFFTQTGGAS